MSIFNKKSSSDMSGQIDKLYKELALQIEVNQELKNENEKLKNNLLSSQKEMARFEKNLRSNPLSQLEILHKEMNYILKNTSAIIEGQNDRVRTEMICRSKDICKDGFELLNQLKRLTGLDPEL